MQVTYAGIPEAIFTIMKVGKGALLAKFDIKRAYYQCRLPIGIHWVCPGKALST